MLGRSPWKAIKCQAEARGKYATVKALICGRLVPLLGRLPVCWGCPSLVMWDSSSRVERLRTPRDRESESAVVPTFVVPVILTSLQTAPQSGPTGTQGPSKSGNKRQRTFRNPTRLPEGRFSGHERLPASLRGMSTKNRDHNGPRAPHNEPRTPQDIQGTLRKSRSQVPRPSWANGPRPRATGQRSLAGQKGRQNEC
ncbi:hypothetical protein CRG98_023827 [Punica granatum]|uniref:Uncharacterized protein n=1 Tax=Punica granatum TaxID=22663 RepID=A0A2I0JHR6_PUNGR|nr:hypothetical protein CRG98_023827 [Punica granatum]